MQNSFQKADDGILSCLLRKYSFTRFSVDFFEKLTNHSHDVEGCKFRSYRAQPVIGTGLLGFCDLTI